MNAIDIKSPTLHSTTIFSILVFIVTIVFSIIFKIEVVSKGQGIVIPKGRVQVIQPEFSGIISKIHVDNGSLVSKGDLLIEFDSTDVNSDLRSKKLELEHLSIELLRHKAMLKVLNADLNTLDPVNHIENHFIIHDHMLTDRFVNEQRSLLLTNIERFINAHTQLISQIDAAIKSEAVIRAQILRINSMLEIQTERLVASQQLLDRATISRFAYLDVLEAYTELEKQKDILNKQLEELLATRQSLELEISSLSINFRNDILERIAQIDTQITRISEEKRVALRHSKATQIISPTTGVVDQLSVFTLGGVVHSGTEIMRIVPSSFHFEIESKFQNKDIGFLEVGQNSNIRIDAFPSERFGFLKGKVRDISPDSSEISDGEWHYIVRITPDNEFLEFGENNFLLKPGMTVTVYVITEKRRLISYFFAPIVATIQNALGER